MLFDSIYQHFTFWGNGYLFYLFFLIRNNAVQHCSNVKWYRLASGHSVCSSRSYFIFLNLWYLNYCSDSLCFFSHTVILVVSYFSTYNTLQDNLYGDVVIFKALRHTHYLSVFRAYSSFTFFACCKQSANYYRSATNL